MPFVIKAKKQSSKVKGKVTLLYWFAVPRAITSHVATIGLVMVCNYYYCYYYYYYYYYFLRVNDLLISRFSLHYATVIS